MPSTVSRLSVLLILVALWLIYRYTKLSDALVSTFHALGVQAAFTFLLSLVSTSIWSKAPGWAGS